jgi:phenylpropionate dioxygenase-like ring-hydroxylating dioxygenase large terminal subunit
VPHEQGFPGLDHSRHGLAPVTIEERHGIVFLAGAAGRARDDAADLPELISAGQRLLSTEESVLPINWKIYLESFLEGLHIRTTHRDTFYRYGFDNLNLVEHAGPHSRVTFPFQRIRKLAEVPPEQRRVEGRLTYAYQLFPSTIVAVLSRHTALLLLEPVDVQSTRVTTHILTHAAADGEDAAAAAARDVEFVKQTGGSEDLAIAHAIQHGLATGANDVFTFGRYESAIVHFHRTLDAALAAL